MSEPQLAQALRQMGIDPIGMSRLDMLREYSRVLRNTTPEVATESEMRNTQEQLPSERALKQDQQTAKYIPQDLSNEPSNPTRTDTTGAGEGATDASTRILTTEELSTITPEEALAGYRESLAQNNNKVVSREALKNLADTLDIKIKDGAQKISGTEMESRAGQNITPQVVNIDAIFSGVNDKNARTFRRKAVDLAMRLFRNSQVEVTDTRTMTQINKSGITKTFSDNITPSKVQSANNIKDIVKQGIYGFTTSNINDKNGILYHHFFTPVKFDGGDGIVRTIIKEYTNDPKMADKYYYHQMEFMDGTKNGGASLAPTQAEATNRHIKPSSPNDFILAQNNQKVNGRSYETEVEGLPKDFDVKHYVSEQVEAQQKRSRVPLRERIADTTAELKHYLVDDAVAYERYIKDKNERLNLREGVDRVRSSDMIASQYMKDHGLYEIGKMSNNDINEFQQYLIAKRALEVAEQGKATGRSKAADQALIDSVGNKYAKQEAIVRQYTHDMLEYSAENGLISKKLKDDLIKNNPNYVPMNRVFDVLEKKTGFRSKQLGNLNDQSVVQKMTGSERTVENPIESIMVNTLRMVNEVERNKVAKLIAQSEAFHEKVLQDGEKPHNGYDKLSYMVDGKTVSYEVPELVAREMKNLNNVIPQAAENILKVVGAPTRWLRSGATQNNPIFAVSNLLRDQMQTLVTGKVSANLRGTKDALVATFSPGKKGKELRAELNRAGIIGSEYRQTYGYKSGDLMAQLQSDNNIRKGAIEKIKHPMDALGDLIGRTEYFTRAQQYFGTNGDETTKAQAARNNTLNFGRAGATTRILNRIIPFLNAGVQGGRITVSSFKNRPIPPVKRVHKS